MLVVDLNCKDAKGAIVMMFEFGRDWPLWGLVLIVLEMIAFSGSIVWAVHALVAGVSRQHAHVQGVEGSRLVLDQRLATGDIDPDDYLQLRDLMASDAATPVSAGGGR
jgi:uncharacterized membrane protein